jgi:hypothetical protein
MSRDYAYEALAEVTSTDMSVGRGQLNAALRDIRIQEPELTDSYLLSAEIHERAKMYRVVFSDVALTPTALAKHWHRVKAEVKTARLDAAPPPSLPPRSKEGLEQVSKLMATLWPEGAEHAG